MKKVFLFASVVCMTTLIFCSSCEKKADFVFTVSGNKTTTEFTTPDSLTYTEVNYPQISNFDQAPKDKDGFVTIFDGKSFNGWRGYLKDAVPGRWIVEDGAIKFNGSGGGEAQNADGGDIIFEKKLKNFRFEFEWKVAKGSNSGVFLLAREIKGEPIYTSSPEYQILDNENHPDARATENGNRKSASLYDMIPAEPQNAKPFGQWNTGAIECYKGSVFHFQNGKKVCEYHLWTPQWIALINAGKFKQGGDFKYAFTLLSNLGGDAHEGYIGFQDHGDDVWYRNIKVKILD
ncbi:MAG: DUF1080 domain-containing protein [Tannerella sp.]|jgi:hypothetical protein|nr:DUF1080 domain-containing protein [Tannerella sp.]